LSIHNIGVAQHINSLLSSCMKGKKKKKKVVVEEEEEEDNILK
jgi:hypothetical protein